MNYGPKGSTGIQAPSQPMVYNMTLMPLLDKREWFAGMAMQGMVAHGWCDGNDEFTAKAAFALADEMIKRGNL